IWDIIIIG
ncbi:hypothetical protein, partial [Klebsiella phage vB_Kpn_3]